MSARELNDSERKLPLSIRTSVMNEFRDAHGVLRAFEVCPGQTTFGILCGVLARIPGVEFPDHEPNSWFQRPSRFTYKGQCYEVSIPFENIRVSPADLSCTLLEMDELLDYVRRNVIRNRASRYTLR